MTGRLKTVQARESFFLRLYQQSFPDVASYISKRGGTLEDAKDIFQDSLVIYYEKVVSTGFVEEKTEGAYLFGIARYLWLNKYKESMLYGSIADHEVQGLMGEDALNRTSDEGGEGIWAFLEEAGKKCMEMLKAFYYDRLSMAELSQSFGYSSVRSATVQKYKCLEKVRDTVKEKTLTYEDFIA